MNHSKAMQDALDNVAATANREARMFQPQVSTVFGLDLDQIAALIDFFQEQTGLTADQIGHHRKVIVVSPDRLCAVDAIRAHGFHNYHPGRVVIVTPDSPHAAEGLSRELPWTVINAIPHDARYWSMFERVRARLNNEPSDMRVAFARAGII